MEEEAYPPLNGGKTPLPLRRWRNPSSGLLGRRLCSFQTKPRKETDPLVSCDSASKSVDAEQRQKVEGSLFLKSQNPRIWGNQIGKDSKDQVGLI